jgi:hypothetical protein
VLKVLMELKGVLRYDQEERNFITASIRAYTIWVLKHSQI